MRHMASEKLKNYKRNYSEVSPKIIKTVSEIIENVRKRGDDAIIEYSRRFDNVKVESFSIKATEEEIERACKNTKEKNSKVFSYFINASKNIFEFHKKQKEKSFFYKKGKSLYGMIVSPLERIGVYVPGGSAFYPSTVMMNIIPAIVAGVKEIYLASPPDTEGKIKNELSIALAIELGATGIFKVGGAQAIAAFAYGTESIPAVSKITGPGNIYVAAAKRLVQGIVGIDSIAGPSEVVIFADESANPEWVATDLCAQAEHSGDNMVALISTSEDILKKTEAEIEKILPKLPRREIIEKSLNESALFVKVKNYDEGFDILNRLAPEHAEIMLKIDMEKILKSVKNAGALFIGNYTPVATGDYYAGPNHVLPTNGTAFFSSPLGVYDFVKHSSVLSLGREYISKYGNEIQAMAEFEGLEAHALSVKIRKG